MSQSSRPLRLGPYELLRPLGVGGMAETFLAVRRGPAGFEQRVCLKRILRAYAEEPSFVEQFLDEARLLAHMHCATIVKVLDFGELAGSYYMALELVDGVDLETLLQRSARQGVRLPLAVSLYITAQLLSALEYAHGLSVDGQALHIVHRDISPSNILLSKRGEVKLADFGIAKSSRRSYKTRPGKGKGKLAYMGPEQLRGDSLDARSDLFALGVVLHEMLSNVHPFDADNEHALLSNIQHGTRPELASLVPDLPEDVARLLDRLLEVDLLARAQSAREALDMLPLFGSQFSVQRSLAELVELHASARAEDASEAQPSPAPTTEPLGSHAERTVDVAAIASDRTLGAHARVSGAAARVSRGAKWALVSALMATLAYALWLGGSRAPRLVRAPTSSTAVRDAGPSRGERAVALPGALSPALEPATPASPALHQASPAQPPAAALELPVRPAAAAEARGSAHEQNGEAPPPAAAQVKGRSGVALRADEF